MDFHERHHEFKMLGWILLLRRDLSSHRFAESDSWRSMTEETRLEGLIFGQFRLIHVSSLFLIQLVVTSNIVLARFLLRYSGMTTLSYACRILSEEAPARIARSAWGWGGYETA